MLSVNDNAIGLVQEMIENEENLDVRASTLGNGTSVIDAGVNVQGGYRAGRIFSEICMGGLGEVRLSMEDRPKVHVQADHAPISCLGSQYAGWSINVNDYNAMGAGPARALSRVEDLFEELGYEDDSKKGVLTLESGELPGEEVADYIAEKCGIEPEDLYLLVAPTASIVGSVQISARVVETGIHKLHTIGFDVDKIISGIGSAPVAPVAENDLKAMGKTNDCTLYGGKTIYNVNAEDSEIEEIIDEVPSQASEDYGSPFLEIFEKYDRDFFKIDRELFSPAKITINNVNTGSVYQSGEVNEEVLRKSLKF